MQYAYPDQCDLGSKLIFFGYWLLGYWYLGYWVIGIWLIRYWLLGYWLFGYKNFYGFFYAESLLDAGT